MTILLPALFGAVGDAALAQGVDKGCSPTVANPCTNSSSGGGSSSRPTYRDTAAEEANARRVQAHNLNQDGFAAFNRGDYALALNLFMKAHQFAPDNAVIKKNLENAQLMYDEEIRQKKAQEEAARHNKAAVAAMQQSANALANSLTVTSADGLDFDSNTNLTKSPSLDFNNGSAPPCGSGASGLSFGDTKTVDARCVPSGLTKFIDSSIEKSFTNSPPGVGERVRKGFQALMTQDRSVARAWFQQALERDPNNEELKRLVDLVDYTSKYQSRPKVVQTKPLQAGELIFSKEAERELLDFIAFFPPSAQLKNIQVPQPDDVAFLFMGKDAPTVFVDFGDGTFKTFQPAVGGTIFLADGPYTVQPDGGLKPSNNEEHLREWGKYFKNDPASLVPPPNSKRRP